MNHFFKFLVLFLTCHISLLQAQTVTGKITDEFGPVNMAEVFAKNSKQNTISDEEGNFRLENTKPNDILIVTTIDGVSKEFPLNNKSQIDIFINKKINLKEVVAIGYGNVEKKDLTGSITTLSSEELEKTPTSNVMNAIQGKVAGVQIVNSGAPGSSPEVKLRGVGSYNAGTTHPLYVVDGMFYSNIDFLNTSDIKSVNFLKDASSAAIYGVRAANGVVLIETKSGSYNKKTSIEYSSYGGIQVAQNILKMANTEQFSRMAYESGSSADIQFIKNAIAKFGRSRINANLPAPNTDWYKEVLRPAPTTNNALNINGGSEKLSYSFGANYITQKGIMNMKNEYKRYNFRTKIDAKLSDRLTVGTNNIFSDADQYNPENGAWFLAYHAVPTMPTLDPSNTTAYPIPFSNAQELGYRNPQNPLPVMNFNQNFLKIRKILTNAYLEYKIIPEKLIFKTQFNHDFSSIEGRSIRKNFYISGSLQRNENNIFKENNNFSNKIWDNTLTYTNKFKNHNLTTLIGSSFIDESAHLFNATGFDIKGIDYESSWYLKFADKNTFLVGDNGQRYYTLSYFGRLAYNYAKKYYLYATYRADGSSKYSKNPWGYFPSFGLGWVISKENFMRNVKFIDFLKLRASWGKLGNNNIGASSGTRTYSKTYFPIGNEQVTAFIVSNNFSNLSWEVVEEYNMGANLNMFKNRFSLDVDYYLKDTKNAVIPVFQPIASNFVEDNAGTIRNSGVEISVNWKDQLSENWSYSIGGNFTTLKNKVMDLYGQKVLYSGQAEFQQITKVGESIRSFYGYEIDGVFQTTEEAEAYKTKFNLSENLEPGDFRYKDINQDGKIDGEDRKIIGSYLPSILYGGNLGINYKKLALSVSFYGQIGNKILNRKRAEIIFTPDTNMDRDLAVNRWHGEGTTNSYPSSKGLRKGWNQRMNGFWIEDGSYFRVQNIRLSYTLNDINLFNENKVDVNVFVTAEKPYTYFTYNGFSPETTNGIDRNPYPIPSIYTLGLNIKF